MSSWAVCATASTVTAVGIGRPCRARKRVPIAGVLTADGATIRSPPTASCARIVSRARSCSGANALMLCAAAPSETSDGADRGGRPGQVEAREQRAEVDRDAAGRRAARHTRPATPHAAPLAEREPEPVIAT